MSHDEEKIMGHEYDGIQEYDNPTPGWWVWTFVATFVFSVGYLVYYHAGPGLSVEEEYLAEVTAYEELRAKIEKDSPVTAGTIEARMTDAAAMTGANAKF